MTSAKKQNVSASKPMGHLIDEKLLAILACPACQGDVVLKENKIVCTRCQRIYPIVDGIPVLLVDPSQA
jgi:uncharacterized protein YbaR (Trm112 family)